jgi:glutamate-1-semialdehyde 2,1-aminomutase
MATGTQPTIKDMYIAEFSGSQALHERARKAISGGITHDGRYFPPFPPYMTHAQGGHKWDVDGHELIDYCVGHGSLLFGHSDPEIVSAMESQVSKGTHFSAGHEAEIKWAEQVVKLIPSAELVRFTASGTESTLLAMRVARGYTQKNTILKFEGHFHGWQDYALKGEKPPFESPNVPGVPAETLGTVAVVQNNDLAQLEERLTQGDIAGIIIEPSGGSWSTIPLKEGYLQAIRDLATKYDAVLIFDEVITGFRWSSGGAQGRFGVTPDLTTMAKIVAGGMPGGAVAGKREIMEMIAFREGDKDWNEKRRTPQAGTYNANPLAAAAGFACLTKAENPEVHNYCDDLAAQLRVAFNTILKNKDVPGFAWGESSVFHVAIGQRASNLVAGDLRSPEGISVEFLKQSGGYTALEQAMLLEGVHFFHGGGLMCTAHTQADVDHTVAAFEKAIDRLEAQGAFDS